MNIISLIVLLILSRRNEPEISGTLHTLEGYLNSIEIDTKYTLEKIEISKKIRPYVPIEYTESFNKSIIITESIVKLTEVNKLINSLDTEFVYSVEMESTERIKKIINIVQNEIQSASLKDLGFALDLISNIENYKKIFGVLTTVLKEPGALNDPNSLMKLMDVFLAGSVEKDKSKIKDLSNMIDIFKMLDSTKKDKPNEA